MVKNFAIVETIWQLGTVIVAWAETREAANTIAKSIKGNAMTTSVSVVDAKFAKRQRYLDRSGK